MEEERANNNQDTSEEENEGKYVLLDIKTIYKTIVIKTAWLWCRDKFTNKIRSKKRGSRYIHIIMKKGYLYE